MLLTLEFCCICVEFSHPTTKALSHQVKFAIWITLCHLAWLKTRFSEMLTSPMSLLVGIISLLIAGSLLWLKMIGLLP